jgi:hypothetical protein
METARYCGICKEFKAQKETSGYLTGMVYSDGGWDESYYAHLECGHCIGVEEYSAGAGNPRDVREETLTPEYCRICGIGE